MQNSLVISLFTFLLYGIHSVSAQTPDEMRRVIVVTPSDCMLLEQHVPDDDVKYKPDVDVRGNATVPAEIKSASRFGLPENGYSFFMIHDALKDNEIAKELGMDDAQEGKIILGRVSVIDGEVHWNGSSLARAETERLYLLCADERSGKKRPILKR